MARAAAEPFGFAAGAEWRVGWQDPARLELRGLGDSGSGFTESNRSNPHDGFGAFAVQLFNPHLPLST